MQVRKTGLLEEVALTSDAPSKEESGDPKARLRSPPLLRQMLPTLSRWDLVLLALAAAWLVILLEFQLVPFLFETATLEMNVTPVLVYATLPLSVGLFCVSVFAFKDRRVLAPVYGLSAVVGALSLFEDVWHLVGAFSPSYGFPLNPEGWILLASWSLLGLGTSRRWHLSYPFLLAVVGFVGVFLAWFAIGYPQLGGGTPAAVWFNWATKVLSFLVLVVLLWPRRLAAPPSEALGGSDPGRGSVAPRSLDS